MLALARATQAPAGSPAAFQGPMGGFARGLAHQLTENFGALDRATLARMDRDLERLIGELETHARGRNVPLGNDADA